MGTNSTNCQFEDEPVCASIYCIIYDLGLSIRSQGGRDSSDVMVLSIITYISGPEKEKQSLTTLQSNIQTLKVPLSLSVCFLVVCNLQLFHGCYSIIPSIYFHS